MTKTEYITLLSRITVSVMHMHPENSEVASFDIAERIIAEAVGRADKVFLSEEDAHLE